jgi:hypothetical protein
MKMEGIPPPKQMFLLINSQHVSAQTGHYQMVLEGYTNSNRIHINYNAKEIILGLQFILSRVRGSVTNNNGFWIGGLDVLEAFCHK